MAKYTVENIRNIALCGHKSMGKTTLVDRMLTSTGTVNRPASVDEGTSICDFDDEEKAHRYTIESSVVHFDYAGKHFHVIDTPGYPDFVGQAIGAMRGVDTAAIVINAQAGIEVNTRRVFAEAAKAGLGRMIILSRLDGENIEFPVVVERIKEMFGAKCVLLNVPIGLGAEFRGVASTLEPPADAAGAVIDPAEIHESLIESIIMADEQVMERYFEGIAPTKEELSRLITQAVAEGALIPMVCVSGKTGVGFPELMDALATCSVPVDKIARKASKPADNQELAVTPDPNGPLVAQVFKTRIDPFVQRLSFIRVYSGTLKKDATVQASGARKGVKIAQLFHVQAGETEPLDEAIPGEIVAVTKVEDLQTGSTLGEWTMPSIPFPVPMVALAANPKSRGDEAKLSGSLAKLEQEDSTFRREPDSQTKEMVIYGMSELHLQLLRERLKRRDKVEVETKDPKIPYRETIQNKAEGMYRHKKQTGGRGQFGEVHIRMLPLPVGRQTRGIRHQGAVPVDEELPLPSGEQLPLDRLGRRRHDSQQLHARRGKGVLGADQPRRNRRVQGDQCLRGGPFRQAPSGRQFGAGVQDGGLDGPQERLPGGQAEPSGADRQARSNCPQRETGRHLQRHVGPPRTRSRHGLRRRPPANDHGRGSVG